MEDSVFTKIIKGEYPSHRIYEDEHTLAFMDIHPVQHGHVVVVPKSQVAVVWDLNDEEYRALMTAVQKIGQRLKEVFPDKKRIGVAIEGLGVQDHAHVNIFPFDTAAEFRHVPDSSIEPDYDALAKMAERLKF
jgi:histidine triad (HIT) family protein